MSYEHQQNLKLSHFQVKASIKIFKVYFYHDENYRNFCAKNNRDNSRSKLTHMCFNLKLIYPVKKILFDKYW